MYVVEVKFDILFPPLSFFRSPFAICRSQEIRVVVEVAQFPFRVWEKGAPKILI